VIYVVRSNTGQFYRRGKLVRSREAASFGHSPSGAAGILERARAAFPSLQWEAVPFRDAVEAPYCAKLAGSCPDGCAGVKVACSERMHGDCWRVKQPTAAGV
jgi:hypothetical protein